MNPVPKEQVAELIAAVRSYSRGEWDDDQYDRDMRGLMQQRLDEVVYLFKIPGWDVLEVTNAGSYLGIDDIDMGIGEIGSEEKGSVVRYLLLTPNDQSVQAKALMGLPRWDKYIQLGVVLSDGDKYFPLTARYKGAEDPAIDVRNVIDMAIDGLDEKEVRIQMRAPRLPKKFKEWRAEIGERQISGSRQEGLIRDMMALNELQFLEAVTWLIPLHEQAQNGWLNNDPHIAKRGWEIKESRPEWAGKMKTAPWKTGRSLPFRYRPIVRYIVQGYKNRELLKTRR